MSLLDRLFDRSMVDCPRCLGKGKVDSEDIKRLKKELFWTPGKCAYCNGTGKVPPDRIKAIKVDFEYLTNDLSAWERHKLIAGDEDALQRAKEHKKLIQDFIDEITRLYYIENREPSEIADYFLYKQGRRVYLESEKQEIIDYIKKVLKSHIKN